MQNSFVFIDGSPQIEPSAKQGKSANFYDSVSYEEAYSTEKSFNDTSLVEISHTNQNSPFQHNSSRTKSADDGKADYCQLSPNHLKESEGMRKHLKKLMLIAILFPCKLLNHKFACYIAFLFKKNIWWALVLHGFFSCPSVFSLFHYKCI